MIVTDQDFLQLTTALILGGSQTKKELLFPDGSKCSMNSLIFCEETFTS